MKMRAATFERWSIARQVCFGLATMLYVCTCEGVCRVCEWMCVCVCIRCPPQVAWSCMFTGTPMDLSGLAAAHLL